MFWDIFGKVGETGNVMTGLSKFKYIIVILAALAVVASVTAFSVSYAKWTAGETELNASVGIGAWDESTIPSENESQYDNGIVCVDAKGNKICDVKIIINGGYGQSIYLKANDKLEYAITLYVNIKTKVPLLDDSYNYITDKDGNIVYEEVSAIVEVMLQNAGIYELTVNYNPLSEEFICKPIPAPGSSYDGMILLE